MKTFQFTVARRIDGQLEVIPDLLTPIVTAANITTAINSPEIVQFCTDHQCVVYKDVSK